ncbi:hypothetical protein HDU93_001785 [Gonapodya sp. JEL0774]|nr:hypothetical protein HDU93_001785 [Gonapodya sp. JEL0774]
MDLVPLEICHRIFRFLSPKCFYSVLPRLSRRIRASALGAIPGCNGDSIGVACEVIVTSSSHKEVERGVGCPSQSVWVRDDFRVVKRGPGTRSVVVWAAVSARIILAADDVVASGGLDQLIETALNKHWSWKSRSSTLIVVRASVDYRNRKDTSSVSFQKLVDLVRERHVPEFGLHGTGDDRNFELLDALAPEVTMISVVRVVAPNLGRPSWWIMAPLCNLHTVLRRFPRAIALEGSSLFPVAVSEHHIAAYRSRLLEDQYMAVRSLFVKFKSSFAHLDAMTLLQASHIFPNLTELGQISIFGGNWKHYQRTLLPSAKQWPGSRVPLQGVRKVHLELCSGDLEFTRWASEVPPFAQELMDILPALRCLVITIVLKWKGGSKGRKRVGTLLDALLRGAPAGCIIQIVKISDDAKLKGKIQQSCRQPDWPEVLRRWDGGHSVQVVNGRLRSAAIKEIGESLRD